MTETYEVKEIVMDEVELLPVFAMRDEMKKGDVETLAASIKELGLLNPLIVRPILAEIAKMKGFKYQLISGHRRFLALQVNKAKTAPARVIEVDDATAFVLALTENIERKDPEPLEEARAFRRAVDELHMQVKDIAKQIRKSPSYVSNRMRLLELPQQVQEALENKEITPGHCEHGFLQLKHQQDQIELLRKTKERDGGVASISEVKDDTRRLSKNRADIEALANKLRELGDQVKFPKCPKCGSSPEPSYGMDLRRNKVQCGKCYHEWNLVKGDVRERESTLDGSISNRETVPGGESVVKVESVDHISQIPIQSFFDHLAAAITKSKAVNIIQIGEDFDDDRMGDLSITIKVDRKKFGKLPNVLLTPPEKKGAKNVTDVTLQGGGWGTEGNKEVLEHRKRLWALEQAIFPEVKPAGIIHHELERLVVDHVALSKGKVLETNIDDNTVFEVLAVHRDYTAIMKDTTHNETRFFEEKEVRTIVKAAKKAGAKAGKKKPAAKKAPKFIEGVCAVCGCTEDEACEDDDGDTCSWANADRTLCSKCAHKCDKKKKSKVNGTTYCGLSEADSYCIDDDLGESSAFECPKGFKRGEKPKGVK